MSREFVSIAVSTAGLAVAAIVAMFLAASRPRIRAQYVPTIRRIAILGVILQMVHFAEETSTGFYTRFPEFLGLARWSETFFISFNLLWACVWVLSIAYLKVYPRLAVFSIWFLGIASAANGVVHPSLSLATGGYFPGLWSSLFVGVLGVLILRALASATSYHDAR